MINQEEFKKRGGKLCGSEFSHEFVNKNNETRN